MITVWESDISAKATFLKCHYDQILDIHVFTFS